MSDEKPANERKDWSAPEIIEVGGVAESTGWGNENVRDNQCDDNPKYTDPPKPKEAGVALPEGE
jgi:hypothetical protein